MEARATYNGVVLACLDNDMAGKTFFYMRDNRLQEHDSASGVIELLDKGALSHEDRIRIYKLKLDDRERHYFMFQIVDEGNFFILLSVYLAAADNFVIAEMFKTVLNFKFMQIASWKPK